MKSDKLWAAALLSCMLLIGCGGGHGNSGPNFRADRSLAQGLYDGTIVYDDGPEQLRFNQQTVVLETGEFFIVYGNTYDTVFLLDGFLHGTGQISDTSFDFYSYDLNDYFFQDDDNTIDAVYNGRLTASFSPGEFFNGSTEQADSTADFTGTVPRVAIYDYNAAATLTSVAGDWNMVDLLGNSLTVSVSGLDGSFAGIYPNACSFSGSLTPRASGKNVFNMTISFGPTPCPQPSQSFSGIAYDYAPSPLARTLVMAGVTVDGSQGTTLFGIR